MHIIDTVIWIKTWCFLFFWCCHIFLSDVFYCIIKLYGIILGFYSNGLCVVLCFWNTHSVFTQNVDHKFFYCYNMIFSIHYVFDWNAFNWWICIPYLPNILIYKHIEHIVFLIILQQKLFNVIVLHFWSKLRFKTICI